MHDDQTPTSRLLPEEEAPREMERTEAAPRDADGDDALDDAVIAADDTGLVTGERLITIAELAEGRSGAAGDV